MPERTQLENVRDLSDCTTLKTFRYLINLGTNVLIVLTVVLCVWFACSFEWTHFNWHIILCVLGYELFMTQGVLVLSRYNCWSVYLSLNVRRHLHIILQLLGFVLAATGTCFMLNGNKHFNTVHGSLGLCALMTSMLSTLNGGLAHHAYKLIQLHGYYLKFFHNFSGILTLFLSSAALTTGFTYLFFRFWIQNNTAVEVLILITWTFTFLVSIEFWIVSVKRLRKGF